MVRALARSDWEAPAVGEAIGFETIVAGRRIVRSWARREENASPRVHRIRVWQEVDFNALNRPGGIARAVFDIGCGARLDPRTITIFSASGTAHMRRAGRRFSVRLANGSRVTVADGPWQLVLPDNVPALVAFYLRVLEQQKRLPFDGRALLTGTLQAISYNIAASDGGFKTSLGEWLTLGRDGWLSSIRQGAEGPVVARRITTAPPRWRRLGPTPIATSDNALLREGADGVRERDVSMSYDGQRYWGRLISPKSRQQAVAFLIGGSGSHDRFGQSGVIDLGYRDIALGLAKRGVAVLQVDKPGAGRTRAGNTILRPRFTRTIAVARAWMSRLQELAGLAAPLFLIGHSEGGQVATVLAGRHSGIAGVCLLATAYDEIDRVIAEQQKTDLSDLGIERSEARRQLRDTRRFFSFVRGKARPATLPERLKPFAYLVPWYRELLRTSPSRQLSSLRTPVLILQGAADIQVSPGDARQIARLARKTSTDVTIEVFEGLDHLMKRSRPTTNISRYGDRRRRVAPSVIDSLYAWIASRSAARSRFAPKKHRSHHDERRQRDKRTRRARHNARQG